MCRFFGKLWPRFQGSMILMGTPKGILPLLEQDANGLALLRA